MSREVDKCKPLGGGGGLWGLMGRYCGGCGGNAPDGGNKPGGGGLWGVLGRHSMGVYLAPWYVVR